MSTCIHLELQAPRNQFLARASHYYNTVITMHRIIMIFFVVMPILMSDFSNFIIPLQRGSQKMVFPRANSFAF